MNRVSKVYRKLLYMAKATREKGNYRIELNMKNGDEVTIYLPGEPITHTHRSKDYTVVDNDDRISHYNTLSDISTWICERY